MLGLERGRIMKRILLALALLALGIAPALAQKTKSQLNSEVSTNLPDNTTGAITPAILRTTLNDLIASWQQYGGVNTQGALNYTVAVSDYGQVINLTNSGSVAVTLPQATGSFQFFSTTIKNAGAGTVTVTPATSTINGATSLTIPGNNAYYIVSDGTNWQAISFGPGGGAVSMAGDCTGPNSAIVCTKTNGTVFAASATINATNATNISSGTLNTTRLPFPFTSGLPSGSTSTFATTTGTLTGGHCVQIDASGNLIDAGAACGTGGGGGGVTSFNSRVGAVVPAAADYGFNQISGTVAAAQLPAITNSMLATATQNTVKGAATSTAVADLTMPSCSATGNALQWTTNTGFGCTTISAGSGMTALPNNQIYVGNVSSVATAVALTGDCSITAAGVITCTKTNGTLFAASATTDATNASNIGSGTLNAARLPSGTTQTIASGALALSTSAIASAACSTAQTATATGTATTDTIIATFNADVTGVTGYIPSTSGMLTIIYYPTANTVNFKVCNNTTASISPGAVTLNWRVVR